MRDYSSYLILAVFIASGVSFFDGLYARLFVRLMIVVIGLVAGIGTSLALFFGIAISAGFDVTSLGPDWPRMIGDFMLDLYLGACVLTCVPLLPAQQLRTLVLGLHFILLPIATFLTTFSALSLPWEIRLAVFAHALSLGLIYAMLWFRMIERPIPLRSGSAPVN